MVIMVYKRDITQDAKGEQIKNYFRDVRFLGVGLAYLHDDPNMPGTGGAILNALKRG